MVGRCLLMALVGAFFGYAVLSANAAPPWEALLPFKRVESNSNRPYDLTKDHGPWMILAASFSGESAEQQAHELVLELRREFQLPAYVHRQTYDFTQPVQGKGFDETGRPRQMKYNTAAKYDAVAVLVGDFASVEDPNLDKALEKLKYAFPVCLDPKKRPSRSEGISILRDIRDYYHRVHSDPDKKKRGPMGAAFATRNPLLPEEYFVSGGLDKFVVDMNKDLQYNLLKCPGRYSVRVATFRGQGTMNLQQMAAMGVTDELDKAAEKAHKLTLALRKQGIEAYEFHDRHESVVTIGSFDSVGTPRQDGKTEINPAVLQIMQTYGAERMAMPGMAGQLALQPKRLEGISFDAQPLPVETPQASIGAAYAEGNRQLNF
jgi:hypothetical protein